MRNQRQPTGRFTVRQLMVSVAIAAWVSLNARAWLAIDADLPRAGGPGGWVARALAFVAAPAIGLFAAGFTWRFTSTGITPGHSPFRWAAAWGVGGLAAWFPAAIALCIDLRIKNSWAPMIVFFLGGSGGVCSGVAGLVLGMAGWVLRRRRPPGAREAVPGGST